MAHPPSQESTHALMDLDAVDVGSLCLHDVIGDGFVLPLCCVVCSVQSCHQRSFPSSARNLSIPIFVELTFARCCPAIWDHCYLHVSSAECSFM